MARRPARISETVFQSSLRDILLEVIAPAFIMLMLGSLFFFFMEIFYRGEQQLPIHWIFGLYVFAIVLVSRISIVEGLSRAHFFSAALIGAVVLQTGIGPHLILVLATWWAASKLTWDCTFIDESRDVSGQGLVSAAFERWRSFRKSAAEVFRGEKSLEQVLTPAEQPQIEPGAHPVTRWMREILWKRKRKNTPGIWAFFFLIAGLVLFAVGQLFIEGSARARNYSLWMFAIYTFAGLGLMMFISLIGMFRYLRQRGTSMPDGIARTWLAFGTLFALGLVGAMLVIPWPNTGVSLSSLVPRFRTAKVAGDRSPLTERGKVDDPSGGGKPDEKGASGKGDDPADRQGRGGLPGGDKQGNQPQGKPGTESGGEMSGGKTPQPASAQGSPSQSKSSQKSTPSRPRPGQKQAQQSNDRSSKQDPSPSDNAKQQKNQTGEPPPPETSKQPNDPSSQPSTAQKSQSQNSPAQSENRPEKAESRPAEKQPSNEPSPQRSTSSAKEQTPSSAPKKPIQEPQAGPWWQVVLKFLMSILSFLIWLAALIVGGYLAIRFRNEIVDGVSKFVKSLSDLLARWFGGKKSLESAAESARVASAPSEPARPFAAYRNPFADANWVRRPASELLAYTFSAFEALARDAKMSRSPDETPLEFTRRVADRHHALDGALSLAELYSQLAYASASFSPEQLQPLSGFWSRMQSFAGEEQRVESRESRVQRQESN